MMVERLLHDYWPATLAAIVLIALLRLGKQAVAIMAGTVEETPKKSGPTDVSGSISWAVVRWLVLAVVLATATGTGLYFLLGAPRLPNATSFTTSELLDILKIGLAVVGGLGAVVALVVAYRKQQVSEAAHLIATDQEQRERNKFFNERYGKAAEQLGHESFAVRLAGVYAMGSLAKDWQEGRQICVDVLCGYLRAPYPQDNLTESGVRQAIAGTLLDLPYRVKLDLRGAEFEDVDLSGRRFSGELNFDNAVFRGHMTDFSQCEFAGTMTFRGAVFESEHTSFSHSYMTNATFDFTNAEFSGEVHFDGVIANGIMMHIEGLQPEQVAEAFRELQNASAPGFST